jgi:putative SOS response-associated peptidase YedK
MCGGVEYQSFNPKTGRVESRRTYFPIPKAQLPVVGSKGAALVTWGRREGEFEELGLPKGGWARLDSLEKGKWNRYHPQPVIIPVSEFMEKDKNGKSHWFKLKEDEVIRGVGVVAAGKAFVYVVTTDAGPDDVHVRTPCVITLAQARQLGDFSWENKWPWQEGEAQPMGNTDNNPADHVA